MTNQLESKINIWKISSRFSKDGNLGSSVLHLFRKYQLLFAYNIAPNGKKLDIENKVKVGDLIGMSDGFKIVAIGKVLKEPISAKELDLFNCDDLKIYKDENIITIKIKLIDIAKDEIFKYKKIGRFHALPNLNGEKIKTLWENQFNEKQSAPFSINAKTCTLRVNSQVGNETILKSNERISYIIPIYQRPYSWSELQIRKFLSDIFFSYWGNDKNIIEEPMFIGTMQLSAKKPIDLSPGIKPHYEQDVIDGQQRLTTFLILLKVMSIMFPNIKELQEMPLNWLETRVNNGIQMKNLENLLKSDLNENAETLNLYLKNAYLIKEILNENIIDEDNKKSEFDILRFINYLESKVYFVVIETYAGLSKTLQIFNSINTAGLDLNAGDIFKIRMYEYLRDLKGKDESIFDDISAIYQYIEARNNEAGKVITDIGGILNIYQYVLIAKYELPIILNGYSTETFFERLFDCFFNINQWEHFKTHFNEKKAIELKLEEIKTIIEIRYSWEKIIYNNAENSCAVNFIKFSRYSRYWVLVFIFMFKYKYDLDKLFRFSRQINKLYFLYSIIHPKTINIIHGFTYKLIQAIETKDFNKIIECIDNKINSHNNKERFKNLLEGDIASNAKAKNLICRLSAMLEEDHQNSENEVIVNIRKKLFETNIDIEHIQSYNDENKEKRNEIWKEWGANINSIGNLMVLEQSRNRSISNSQYKDKIPHYKDSIFNIVTNQTKKYKDWDLNQCKKRKLEEINRLIEYLFN